MTIVPFHALTLRQPWASLVAFAATDPAAKTVENRGRATGHRGPLAIHAGKSWDAYWLDDPESIELKVRILRVLRTAGIRTLGELPTGVVVAVANVVGCHRFVRTGSRFCCHPWGQVNADHWVLGHVRALAKPVPARGQIAAPWTLPDHVATAVREQLLAVTR